MQVALQMGNAHNSSGSLTGTSVTTEIVSTSVTAAAPVSGATVTASGDGSYIAVVNLPQDNNSAQQFVCERLYDVNGQPVSGGFHLIGSNAGTSNKTFTSQVSYSGSSPAPQQSNGPVFLKSTINPTILDGRLQLGLVFPYAGFPLNPTPNMILATTSEVSPYQLIRYTMYGVERTYRNSTFTGYGAGSQPFSGVQVMLRED